MEIKVDLGEWKQLSPKDRQQQPIEMRLAAIEAWLCDLSPKVRDHENAIELLENPDPDE